MKNRFLILRAFVVMLVTGCFTCRTHAQVNDYPDGVKDIVFQSAADETEQPALFWKPDRNEPVPLLVALHTWSNDYRQAGGEVEYARWCQKADWVFIHPNFRGSNTTPDALGSELAVEDIKSAVAYALHHANVDENRIYCVGVSGGGHASLLMAARTPKIWAGVSAWCGISDIAAWHGQCKGTKFQRYARHIEKVLGGPPDATDRLADARRRSPIHWLSTPSDLPTLDINHGIHDGRTGSVPFTHSMFAWNESVSQQALIAPEVINEFYQTQSLPKTLRKPSAPTADLLYGKNQPIFRVTNDRTRLTIFDGGHEIVHHAALNWLAAQRRGKPAVWNPKETLRIESQNPESQQSGK